MRADNTTRLSRTALIPGTMLLILLVALATAGPGRNAKAAAIHGSPVAPPPVPTQVTQLPTVTLTAVAGTATNTPTPGGAATNTATPGGSTRTATPVVIPTDTSTPGGATNTPSPLATNTRGVPTPMPTGIPTLCAVAFSDVAPSDWFYPYVTSLYCRGAISGYADGTFRPGNNTTRGQLSKIVVAAEGWPLSNNTRPHFSDVPVSNAFYVYIETAYGHGVITGYADGTFRWGNDVTRGQLSKIVVLAQGWSPDTTGAPHFTDVPPSHPFFTYIETAANKGVVSGYADGTFRPSNNATRAQLCKIVQTALTIPSR